MRKILKKSIGQFGSFLIIERRLVVFIATICLSVGLNANTIHWITFIDTDDPNVGDCGKNSRNILYARFFEVVNAELR